MLRGGHDRRRRAGARARDRSSATPRRRRSSSTTCSTCRASSRASCASTCSRAISPAIVASAVESVRPAADAKGIALAARRRSRAAAWSRAIPNGCSRWSGTCCRTRSSSRRRAGASTLRVAARRTRACASSCSDTGRGIAAGCPAAHLRALPPGRQQHDPRRRRARPRPGDRAPLRRDARRQCARPRATGLEPGRRSRSSCRARTQVEVVLTANPGAGMRFTMVSPARAARVRRVLPADEVHRVVARRQSPRRTGIAIPEARPAGSVRARSPRRCAPAGCGRCHPELFHAQQGTRIPPDAREGGQGAFRRRTGGARPVRVSTRDTPPWCATYTMPSPAGARLDGPPCRGVPPA